jgi:hypothetical protein
MSYLLSPRLKKAIAPARTSTPDITIAGRASRIQLTFGDRINRNILICFTSPIFRAPSKIIRVTISATNMLVRMPTTITMANPFTSSVANCGRSRMNAGISVVTLASRIVRKARL